MGGGGKKVNERVPRSCVAEGKNTTPGPKVGRSSSCLSSKAANGTLKKCAFIFLHDNSDIGCCCVELASDLIRIEVQGTINNIAVIFQTRL